MPYCPKLGLRIAEYYADGRPIVEIGNADNGLPGRTVIRRWRRETPEFQALLAHARKEKAEGHAEEALSGARAAVQAVLDAKDPFSLKKADALAKAMEKLAAQQRWHAGVLDPAWGDQAALAMRDGAKAIQGIFGALSRAAPVDEPALPSEPSSPPALEAGATPMADDEPDRE